jgi:hypothetical protein
MVAASGAEAQKFNSGEPVSLRTPSLNIIFDRKNGMPLKYELPLLKENFTGRDGEQSIKIEVRKSRHIKPENIKPFIKRTSEGEFLVPDKTDTILIPSLKEIDTRGNEAIAIYEASIGRTKIVSFNLMYRINEQSFDLSLEDVIEQNGYELTEVQINSMVSIKQAEGNC